MTRWSLHDDMHLRQLYVERAEGPFVVKAWEDGYMEVTYQGAQVSDVSLGITPKWLPSERIAHVKEQADKFLANPVRQRRWIEHIYLRATGRDEWS